jgi:hypothetical protein
MLQHDGTRPQSGQLHPALIETRASALELQDGAQALGKAFLQAPLSYAGKNATILGQGGSRSLLLIQHGFAFRFCVLADGPIDPRRCRRARQCGRAEAVG